MNLGRYELTGVLGEGGMATVFAANDTKLNRQVAVKVMFPHLARRDEAVARFKREARAAAGLDHENILRVFDVGGGEVEEGSLVPPYIVLELVDGESLGDYFKKDTPTPLAEVVAAIGVALCSALTQAHEQGIVHRDIKPANVMVTKQGRLALADFGVAHIGEEESVLTRTGAILGTPAFMSPEQALSDPVDSRSDVYSLGATLYTIATGALPYSGSSAHILASILAGKCKTVEERNPSMGRELSRVIQSMMQTEPEDRIASAAAAAEALREVVHGGGFEDADALVVDYFTGPASDAAVRRKTAVSSTLLRARKMADEGRVPMALSLAERVLTLDSENLQAQTLAHKFGRQRRQRLWPAIVLPMVVTAFVGLVFWGSQPGSIAIYVDKVDDAGPRTALATTNDAALKDSVAVPVNAADDAAVLPIDAAPAKPRARDGRVPRVRPPIEKSKLADAGVVVVVKADAAPLVAPPPQKLAGLIVDIKPWCEVSIGGKQKGRASPSKVISLPAGKYRVDCKQPSTGLAWSKDVTLSAGKTTRVTGTVLADIVVKVRLDKAQKVQIAGRTASNGSSLKLPAGRHRVEILRGGKGDGKPVFLNMRQNCTLRDKSKLACFAE